MALVLRDSLIVDLEKANRALQTNPAFVSLPMPRDMLDLIAQYEYGLKYRLYEIVNDLVAAKRLDANRTAFVHDLKAGGPCRRSCIRARS